MVAWALLQLGLIIRTIVARHYIKTDNFVLTFMAFCAIVLFVALYKADFILDKITFGSLFTIFAVGIFRNVVGLRPEDQLVAHAIYSLLWFIILLVNGYLFIRLSKTKPLPE